MSEAQNTMLSGTLIRGIGSFYTARTPDGQEYTLRAKKKFRRLSLTPLTGDEVIFSPGSGEEHGWVEEILPRRSVLIRPPAANVTNLCLVLAPVPEPDYLLIDRLMVQAAGQGMKVTMIVTKLDLDPGFRDRIEDIYKTASVRVIGVSSRTGEGLQDVREAMRGGICCLAGQSGVGKSTLLNHLFGLDLETGDISEKIQRGKNTTRRTELFTSGDVRVLDSAGFSQLEMEEVMDPVLLKDLYPDFAPYEGTCRFYPCLHDREPGCKVAEACREGKIHPDRLERYRQLLGEVRDTWKTRYS